MIACQIFDWQEALGAGVGVKMPDLVGPDWSAPRQCCTTGVVIQNCSLAIPVRPFLNGSRVPRPFISASRKAGGQPRPYDGLLALLGVARDFATSADSFATGLFTAQHLGSGPQSERRAPEGGEVRGLAKLGDPTARTSEGEMHCVKVNQQLLCQFVFMYWVLPTLL